MAKVLDLRKNKIVGVLGDAYRLQKVVNNLLLQIVMLHSYTDVRIALFEQVLGERYQLEWLRWLPHVFSDDKKCGISRTMKTRKKIFYMP